MRVHVLALAAVAGIFFTVTTHAARADDTGFASSHDLRKEAGKLCMSDHAHSGYGVGTTKEVARTAAIRAWIDFTNLEYGSVWASYSAGASPTTKYTKEASGWGALVEARPCRR